MAAKEQAFNDPTIGYRSSDPTFEERYQRTKEPQYKQESVRDRFLRRWRNAFVTSPGLKGDDIVFEWKGADGKPIFQTRTAGFAPATDRRRIANALHRNVLEESQGVLKNILATVKNPKQFDVFVRKVLADEAVEAHQRNELALENEQNLAVAKAFHDEAVEGGNRGAIKRAREAKAEAQEAYEQGPKYQHREPGETMEAALKDQSEIDAILKQSPGLQSAYDRHMKTLHAVRDELIARGLIHPNAREFYFPHYIIDYMQDMAPKNLPRGVGLSKSKSVNVKRLVGGREWSKDYITAMHTYLTRNMEMLQRHNLLDEIAYMYHVTKRPMASIIRSPGANGLSDLEMYKKNGTIPRGYVRYSLSSGYSKARATSVAEREFGELMDNSLELVAKKFGIEPHVFNEMMQEWGTNPELAKGHESRVQGGKVNDQFPQQGSEVVIPKELADELTIMAKGNADVAELPRMIEKGVRAFKTLAIHLRPIQYNIRNAVGDMNRAVAQFGASEMLQPKLWFDASKDVTQATLYKNYSADWQDAHRFGIMSSGRTAVETTKLRDIDSFRKLTGKPPNLNTVGEWAKWLGAHEAQWREDIFRMYIYKMNKARGVDKMLMGAVDPEYVQGLVQAGEPARAFAAIARRSLIDFGDFTPSEDYLRNGLIPFYSWVKGNLSFWAHDLPKAYGRAIKRVGDGSLTSSDAHALQGAAVTAALIGTVVAWNNHNKDFADANEKLPEIYQHQSHIILPGEDGKPLLDENGRPRVIAVPDAMDDALEAVGMGGIGADLTAYFRGRIDLHELMERRKEAAYKGPVNYGYRSLGPIANVGVAAAGVQTYPDIFNPRMAPPEKRLQTALSAFAVSNLPGTPSVIDMIPGQVSSPSKTLDPVAQTGLSAPQPTRMPFYQEDLVREIRKGQSDLEDLKGRMRAVAGGLSEPQLTPEQRSARVTQMRRVLDLHVSELRRKAERYKALQRTHEASQR